jgi:ribosomal protein L11 methyltransferase
MNPAPSSYDRAAATIELVFEADPEGREILVATLDTRGFEAFLEEDDSLRAYIPAPAWTDPARRELEAWLDARELPRPSSERVIPRQDWNAPWEASFQPVLAGPFVVRASWHARLASPESPYELIVDPKMSFGTGHHESTRLLLSLMPRLIAPGAHVLDAGTGTGILAIAAAKLGAGRVVAYDNDPWIEENARENLAANGVADRVALRIGDVASIDEADFDVVLANINKHVLLGDLVPFARLLRPRGFLALAGLLTADRDEMMAAAARAGYRIRGEASENAWWAVYFERGGP